VKKYAEAFMIAMSKKWGRLVYIDPLAGPGRDINSETGEEFPGSPLVALSVRPKFHKLYFGDASSDHVKALRQRIPPEDLTRVDLDADDCHVRVRKILRDFTRGTLGLAFVDPEGFEVKFDLFRDLVQAQVDVLFLFPTGGVTRNLRLFAVRDRSPLDGLIEDWRQLPVAKRAAGKLLTVAEEAQLKKSVVSEFRDRMRALGFVHQDREDPALLGPKRTIMFHLMSSRATRLASRSGRRSRRSAQTVNEHSALPTQKASRGSGAWRRPDTRPAVPNRPVSDSLVAG
jgi:three-Cys-motif partner protein